MVGGLIPGNPGDPKGAPGETNPTVAPQLRRNSLGLLELVFQGITHIAPAGSIVFMFPIIARQAGPDMPISLLLSTTTCFFIGKSRLTGCEESAKSAKYV